MARKLHRKTYINLWQYLSVTDFFFYWGRLRCLWDVGWGQRTSWRSERKNWTLSPSLQVSSFFLSFLPSFVLSYQNVMCILSSLMHATFPSHSVLNGCQYEKLVCASFQVFSSSGFLHSVVWLTFRDSLTIEVGTDRLSRNVGKQPTNAA